MSSPDCVGLALLKVSHRRVDVPRRYEELPHNAGNTGNLAVADHRFYVTADVGGRLPDCTSDAVEGFHNPARGDTRDTPARSRCRHVGQKNLRIVNNVSSRTVRMLDSEFDATPDNAALRPRVDGRPPPLRPRAALLDSYVTIVRLFRCYGTSWALQQVGQRFRGVSPRYLRERGEGCH